MSTADDQKNGVILVENIVAQTEMEERVKKLAKTLTIVRLGKREKVPMKVNETS